MSELSQTFNRYLILQKLRLRCFTGLLEYGDEMTHFHKTRIQLFIFNIICVLIKTFSDIFMGWEKEAATGGVLY